MQVALINHSADKSPNPTKAEQKLRGKEYDERKDCYAEMQVQVMSQGWLPKDAACLLVCL